MVSRSRSFVHTGIRRQPEAVPAGGSFAPATDLSGAVRLPLSCRLPMAHPENQNVNHVAKSLRVEPMKPLRILHVLGQRPEMTGSGIRLEAITKESLKRGFAKFRIAGVPAGRHHRPKESPYAESACVFFESKEWIPWPLP